jgi:HEAT repeat protein
MFAKWWWKRSECFGERVDPSALEAIAECLNDQNPAVLASALRVFGDLAKRTELTLSSIAARLEDEASDVRHAAIDALVAFGDGVNSARIGAITRSRT